MKLDVNVIEFTELQIACACVALGRSLYHLRLKWPFQFERVYNIKFEEFKECYEAVKLAYSQKYLKKQDSSLFHPKEHALNRVETMKTLDVKKTNNRLSHREDQDLRLIELSNNKSCDEHQTNKSVSREKVTYIKKVIKEKINKNDYSDTKVHLKPNEEKNDQLYRLKRPLNINLGNSRNDHNITHIETKKEESKGKSKNLREITKSMLTNYSQIHKKINVSELVGKGNLQANYTNNNITNNNNTNYNNSFLYFHQNLKNENKEINKSKSREASNSVAKQNSFDYNYKENAKKRNNDFSANKYSKNNNNSSHKEDHKSLNKSSVVEKVETTTSTNNTSNNNVSRKGSINIGGISILKRLSNKKSLNLDLKNMYKIDMNYKKLANMNISISGLHD